MLYPEQNPTKTFFMIQFLIMPPYQSSGTHGSSHANGNDADRIHAQQTKTHLENRLRILKNEVLDKGRTLHDIERDVAALEGEVHHVEQEEKRLSEEVRRMSQGVRQDEGASKQSEMGMRDKDQELHRKEDETNKLEREIDALKSQIAEKERMMHEIKQDVSKLMKEKEDFRRAHELGHFTVKSEGEHVHEREVHLTLMGQDKRRKENELQHKQQMHQQLKRDINFKEQEIMQVEAELGRINGH